SAIKTGARVRSCFCLRMGGYQAGRSKSGDCEAEKPPIRHCKQCFALSPSTQTTGKASVVRCEGKGENTAKRERFPFPRNANRRFAEWGKGLGDGGRCAGQK